MTQLAAFVILISGVVRAAASEIVIKRYVVQDGNVCIVAQLAATFFIDYTDVKGVTQTSTLEVGDNAVVQNSSNECADQVMALKFENDRYFSMQFSLNESTSETCVTKITLYTKIDSVTFPGHDSIGKNETIVFSDKSFCTDIHKSYTCNPGTGLKSGDYLLRLSHLRLESFRNSTSTDFMNAESFCREDRRSSSCSPDPIVIGAVVVTLVTCAFLAVLICKLRSRTSFVV